MSATVAVAVSGGRDSMALLHCTARAAKAQGIEVVALHVHHGLMADADTWAEQLEKICARWRVQFAMQRLAGKPGKGESVEAWARRGRYASLAAMARTAGARLVLLAHHRRDQAETFLLQALRGAGAAGLAAMPVQAEREGIVWARPWLEMPFEAIAAYARRHRLKFVEDPSNADPRYARSRLRANVMPALRQAFAEAEAALAAAAAQCAQAQAVLDEVAQADLAAIGEGASLRLTPWCALSEARRRNALRAWLRGQLGRGAAQTLIERLMQELPGTDPAEWPCEGATLHRYCGRLRLVCEAPTGALQSTPVEQGGVALSVLRHAQWRERSGGEQFQRAAGTPPRALKKQFQAASIPAWQRDAPLLFSADGRLLFVPGLGIDARAVAAPGEAQCALAWVRPA
ncbi:MAG: tRNA lysidine(34) synthetase TilS [Burkholderiaceae bacterium]|nr:tRNA lysidine(34) synthetase TilS [Burkholderiaceae bacterium]